MPGILLTGANGQLGSEIHRQAEAADLSCRATTRAELDIVDRDAVFRAIEHVRPGVVINAAAYTAVDQAESDSAAAFAVNRDGPAHLAAACAAADIPLIHISTDYVFDGRKPTAYVEDDAVGPLSVYGESKLAGEEAIRRLAQRHVILRTSWVYGVGGKNFINTILRLSRERDTLRIVDDQVGCPTFTGDLAAAVLAIAGRLRSGAEGGASQSSQYGTFHCAGSGATSWFRLAEKALDIAAPALDRRPIVTAIPTSEYPTPARRPARSVLDCRRLSDVYRLTLRPWEDALADMLAAAGLSGSRS